MFAPWFFLYWTLVSLFSGLIGKAILKQVKTEAATFTICPSAITISRVALADVSGHGHDVSAVTQALRELMHQNINVWDQSDFMGASTMLNKSKKYATAHRLEFPPYHRPAGVQQYWAHASSVVSPLLNEAGGGGGGE